MRLGTNKKHRKQIFYNKLLNSLFVETKAGSGIYVDENKEQVNETTILANKGSIYIDLSLFPAHTTKNYGSPIKWEDFQKGGTNKLAWLFNHNGKEIKPKLIYLEAANGLKQMWYKEILINGVLSKVTKTGKFNEDFFLFRVKEKYKIETKISLI